VRESSAALRLRGLPPGVAKAPCSLLGSCLAPCILMSSPISITLDTYSHAIPAM
jgi:hypothetical protein